MTSGSLEGPEVSWRVLNYLIANNIYGSSKCKIERLVLCGRLLEGIDSKLLKLEGLGGSGGSLKIQEYLLLL